MHRELFVGMLEDNVNSKTAKQESLFRTICEPIDMFVVMLRFRDSKRVAFRRVQQVMSIAQDLRDMHETLQIRSMVVLKTLNLSHLREIIRWVGVQMLDRHSRTYRVSIICQPYPRNSRCGLALTFEEPVYSLRCQNGFPTRIDICLSSKKQSSLKLTD